LTGAVENVTAVGRTVRRGYVVLAGTFISVPLRNSCDTRRFTVFTGWTQPSACGCEAVFPWAGERSHPPISYGSSAAPCMDRASVGVDAQFEVEWQRLERALARLSANWALVRRLAG